MRIPSRASLLALALAASAAANPLFPVADPHVLMVGDTVWIYGTESRGQPGTFFSRHSKDLVHWEEGPALLSFRDVSWITRDGGPRRHAWAPSMIERDGKFYFYYSVGPQTDDFPARTGVAVGDSPEGPFVDSGKPLLTGGNGFEAIDPFVFHDEASDRWLFYAGGSAGATLRVFELAEDMVSFEREIEVETPRFFTEGVFLHQREGVYHLTYSHGSWRHSNYSVHHATAPGPTGPWTYRGRILSSNERHKGPGHHSVLRHPESDDWFIVYHRWDSREGDGPYSGQRLTAIDRLVHRDPHTIAPVEMTDSPVEGWRPLEP